MNIIRIIKRKNPLGKSVLDILSLMHNITFSTKKSTKINEVHIYSRYIFFLKKCPFHRYFFPKLK